MPAPPLRLTRRLRTLLCVAALGAAVCASAGAAAAQAYVFRLGVTGARHGRPIPAGFLGLALEFNEIPQLSGPTAASVNPVFVQLLSNLDPGGRPSVRIGGQSTDRVWWPVRG